MLSCNWLWIKLKRFLTYVFELYGKIVRIGLLDWLIIELLICLEELEWMRGRFIIRIKLFAYLGWYLSMGWYEFDLIKLLD